MRATFSASLFAGQMQQRRRSVRRIQVFAAILKAGSGCGGATTLPIL
jgi:hypothetical protein